LASIPVIAKSSAPAIQYSHYGSADQLRLADVTMPESGKREVRVRVEAASVSAMDWKIRPGEMKMLSSFHDFAGDCLDDRRELAG
jgi:NADPH:quinone reductase-like Zn-dependent oxidoreductase